MGLYHTFMGEDCNGPNDYVADTASHIGATRGCPSIEEADSCPGDGVADPISNFMDYSDDICLTEFTAGQAERMYLHWLLYRSPGESCPVGEALFELQATVDQYVHETYWNITDATTGELVLASPEIGLGNSGVDASGSTLIKDYCLASGSYVFTFGDAYGDGITNGGYQISLDGVQLGGAAGNEFQFTDVTPFVVEAGTAAPMTLTTPAPMEVTLPPVVAPTTPPIMSQPPGSDQIAVTVLIVFDDYPQVREQRSGLNDFSMNTDCLTLVV